MADQRRFLEELRRAWRDEKGAALTYAAAAEKETDSRRRDRLIGSAQIVTYMRSEPGQHRPDAEETEKCGCGDGPELRREFPKRRCH